MTIGFTYDLRSDYLKEGYTEEETAEFDRESTVEGIESALLSLGFRVDRIGHAVRLTERLVRGDRWDMVFNICEGMNGIGREAQVPAILDLYRIPYTFSDPLVLSLTLHKGLTKRVLRDAGIATPEFLLVEKEGDWEGNRPDFPLFVKPNAEGTGKGISASSRVDSPAQLASICRELLARYPSGLIVEEYLPGREYTVGILGTGVDAHAAGIMEILHRDAGSNGIYSYNAKAEYEAKVRYAVPGPDVAGPCISLALAAWRVLGCRDGGRVDIRTDRHGVPGFMEVNPLAGLDRVHSDLPILAYMHGYTFEGIISEIMDSAMARYGITKKPA